ncbi:MAG: hypothetical protein AB7O50_02605 [Pseudolabrys sp.]
MEHMRKYAYDTILRASSFAALGIFCTMFGTSWNMRLAFLIGATLTTIWTLILMYKAREALTKDYRKTEMWICMPKRLRPPASYAQWASATVLRDTYLRVASWCSAIAAALWAGALAASLLGA